MFKYSIIFLFLINCVYISFSYNNNIPIQPIIIGGGGVATNNNQKYNNSEYGISPTSNSKYWDWNTNSWRQSKNSTIPSIVGNQSNPFYYLTNLIEKHNKVSPYVIIISSSNCQLRDWFSLSMNSTNTSIYNNQNNNTNRKDINCDILSDRLLQSNNIVKQLSALNQSVMTPYFIWVQGDIESESLYPEYSYYDLFKNNIVDTIVYHKYIGFISINTYSPDNFEDNEEYIEKYQKSQIGRPEVYAGPNTDTLCDNNRYEGDYLSIDGINLYSHQFLQMINNRTTIPSAFGNKCMYRSISIFHFFISILNLFVMLLFICCIAIILYFVTRVCLIRRRTGYNYIRIYSSQPPSYQDSYQEPCQQQNEIESPPPPFSEKPSQNININR